MINNIDNYPSIIPIRKNIQIRIYIMRWNVFALSVNECVCVFTILNTLNKVAHNCNPHTEDAKDEELPQVRDKARL